MRRVRADADVFRAIADPTRRAILDRLRAGPTPVNALAAGFAASRPSISKHLKILHEAELVAEQKRGRERLHRLRPETLVEVADWARERNKAHAVAQWRFTTNDARIKLKSLHPSL
jgi:DNA-binding transcriptional ArsR family regulator